MATADENGPTGAAFAGSSVADVMERSANDEVMVPDDAQFDVAAFINERFSSEASLDAELDDVMQSLRSAIHSMDNQLSALIRAERHSGAKSARDVSCAAQQLLKLRQQVALAEAAALDSQRALEVATSRIQPLEVARVNLKNTADALCDMRQLCLAIETCERAASEHSLRSLSADSTVGLTSMSQILSKLKDVQATGAAAPLREWRVRADKVREDLRQIVLSEFQTHLRALGNDTLGESQRLQLRSACVVAEELGVTVRAEVIGLYLNTRVAAYETYFESRNLSTSGTAPGNSLQSVEKRLAWLRSDLRNFTAKGWTFAFPSTWNMQRRLASRILLLLRALVEKELALAAQKKALDVDMMLLVLQKSIDFEESLDENLEHTPSTGDEQPDYANADLHNGTSRASQTSENLSSSASMLAGQKKTSGLSQQQHPQAFRGLLSTSFEPYMDAYVKMEQGGLLEAFEKLIQDEKWIVDEKMSVFRSSVELFLQIKKSFRRCSKMSTHKTMLSMFKVYMDLLSRYCRVLNEAIKTRPMTDEIKARATRAVLGKRGGAENPSLGTTSGVAASAKPSASIIAAGKTARADETSAVGEPSGGVTPNELTWEADSSLLTGITTTTEYCSVTVKQLEETVKKYLEATASSPSAPSSSSSNLDEVSASDQYDQFISVSSRGVRYLVRLVMDVRLFPYFAALAEKDWALPVSTAMDESSAHLNAMVKSLHDAVADKAKELSKTYFRFFLERVCVSFCTRYLSCIFRGKGGVNELGAQQLLLDIVRLRRSLLELPVLAPGAAGATAKQSQHQVSGQAATSTYARLVASETGRVESILKVLLSPAASLLDAYVEMVPERSQAELMKIMAIKQIGRAEAESIMSAYLAANPEPARKFSGSTAGGGGGGGGGGGHSGTGKANNTSGDASPADSAVWPRAAGADISDSRARAPPQVGRSGSTDTAKYPSVKIPQSDEGGSLEAMKSLLGRFSGSLPSSEAIYGNIEHLKDARLSERWEQVKKGTGSKFFQ
ncbi:Vacuolar protein sorting-associated protein 53 A [Porphyridium purpureum]|uniref:Vacuolar protein sorting-associated protein 53 A n=1 Tax=Porphyridium purpureum TaxID=35688 RepID=A0A5J4YPS7_PORPP|nr:Vacuolar protein sorting-associated protein 53 A [Porphyridium purpureum]|eukprot:POR8977..scf295_9